MNSITIGIPRVFLLKLHSLVVPNERICTAKMQKVHKHDSPKMLQITTYCTYLVAFS